MTPLRRGFTLIELMVVMAIIAVLLTIAAPRYFNHLDRAREATLRQTLAVVRDAIDKFHGDTSSYPESIEELVTKRYLRAAPVDPITDSAQTWVLLPPPAANGSGKLWDLRSGAEGSGANGTPYAEW
ncbi:MAG: prepilin-type N-terminal cleavage/methylation domain-containing protein [Sulfuritalea sp.]|nr:prepilin-type N-terminal cleavage/methylation domain-containing protein [Sulfuritalea sp.]